MTDKRLADIFYTLVHDFADDIVREAVGEITNGLKARYLGQVRVIKRWAEDRGFSVVAGKAAMVMERIESKLKGGSDGA